MQEEIVPLPVEKEVKKMNKNNIINFSHYFIKKRIIQEGKVYQNEIVGECFECEGNGILLDFDTDLICLSCDGDGYILLRKRKYKLNLTIRSIT